MPINNAVFIFAALLLQLAFHSPFVYCEEASVPEIRIGAVLTTTDHALQQTDAWRAAVTYIEWLNGKGGVAGRPIRLISYDDEGELKKTLDLTRRLIEVDSRCCSIYRKSLGIHRAKP